MINVICICTEWAPIRTGKVKVRGMALCVQCIRSIFHEICLLFKGNPRIFPEGVADFLVCKLRDWVVSFIVCIGGEWRGIVKLVLSLVVVAKVSAQPSLCFLCMCALSLSFRLLRWCIGKAWERCMPSFCVEEVFKESQLKSWKGSLESAHSLKVETASRVT